ncbi:uncharacterized protein LOC107675619 [Sinocyclocheilus anshuiensis]|uniref:uncharacterized protein LOC107675619 n=1 Tax=Sinocyclocheilus anshuiensis TaxID=1608454 RepID=UPI0007B89116|nr:PREDICTED: uncharacterized protein LOC107675619 [Sinocyclocheilus anshuiensis]
MTLLKCQHCVREDKAAEDTDHVEKILPPGYSHLLCHYELLEMSGDIENFRAALKLQMTTEEQVQKWLEDFQKSSALTWRKSRTYPDSGRYNKYRVDLRCQHKTYSSSSKTTKNTNCPATMFLILKRFMYERKSRSGDPHLEEGYFLHVNLRNEHNHRLNTAEAMRWRDVSNDTIEKLQQLYKSGHSPSSALKNIKYSLQEEEGDNYIYATADRSICPDLQFCYRSVKLVQNTCFKLVCGSEMPAQNTSSSSKTTKNTNCPATMFLILKRFMYERKSRSGDPHLEEGYFLHVNLRNEHNHRLNTAEAMRWRDVSNDTIEKLQQLYKSGHSPSSALKNIKYSLQEEEGDNYIYATADRSICPDLQFCYRCRKLLFNSSFFFLVQYMGVCSGKDISDELFKPLELEQSWETTADTEGHTACIEDGVSVDAVPIITTAEHFTEDNEPGPSAAEEVVGSLDGQLEEIFGMLKKKLNEDASFTPPVRAFVSSFFQIKTDSALQASLFSFGKTTPIINQINVLPATGPRRRGALAGRRAVGRPPKNSRREHPYCNSRSNNNPQTLTFCLQDNNTLEKTD